MSAPVLVLALQWVVILVTACAVKLIQTCRVLGEVRRHPVDNNADTRIMALVDKRHKVLGSTESRCRRKISYLLIAPASVKGVLCYRHKLNMGVAHLFNVRNKLICKAAIIIVFLAVFLPGAEVYLVNICGAFVNVFSRKLLAVFLVRPAVALDIVISCCGIGAHLHKITVWVSLELDKTVGSFNAVFVAFHLLYALYVQLPDSAVAYLVHIALRSVPVIKITDNTYGIGMGCPNSEHYIFFSVFNYPMRAKEIVCMGIFSLMEEMERYIIFFGNNDRHYITSSKMIKRFFIFIRAAKIVRLAHNYQKTQL